MDWVPALNLAQKTGFRTCEAVTSQRFVEAIVGCQCSVDIEKAETIGRWEVARASLETTC